MKLSNMLTFIGFIGLLLLASCSKQADPTATSASSTPLSSPSISSTPVATPTPPRPTPSPTPDNSKLTTAKAQDAMDRAMTSIKSKLGNLMTDNAKVTVQGVQEIPQQNMAEADVRYTNARAGCGGAAGSWSSGVATFKHYIDGRWVLTKITTGDNVL